MYLRFVVPDLDEQSNRRTGVFQAVYRLRNRGELHAYEDERSREILDWFNDHLEEPARLSASRRANATNRAISWFKDSATGHLARMYELVAILDAHAIPVEVIKTERPGYVVYEDQFQIIAEPFADTST